MRFKLVLASCALLSTMAARVQAADDWSEFKSSEGAFTVLLPETPKEQVKKIATDAGETDLHLFLVMAKDGGLFLVSYVDYPAKFITEKGVDQVLADCRDGQTKSIGGTVRSEKKTTINEQPAREIIIDTGNFTMKTLNVSSGNRLYQVAVAGPKGVESDAKTAKMFESFKLTGK